MSYNVSDSVGSPPAEPSSEGVPSCPLCGGFQRELLHADLSDRVFFCAPGRWTLYRCTTCTIAYLDPRPDARTTALAYSRYITHVPPSDHSQVPPSRWRRRRVAQVNAYLNAKYGYRLNPATARIPAWFGLGRRLSADMSVRFLQSPVRGGLLHDVGCGNGDFLLRMKAAGWEVSGVEPDPTSSAAAIARGVPVHVGRLHPGLLPDGHFDAITLSHVIEHVSDPLGVLRICWRALKPGGVLYVATPNLGSLGYQRFGANWLALDPPRHLVLFTAEALRRALELAGFDPEPRPRMTQAAQSIFLGSAHVMRGSDPILGKPPLPFWTRLQMTWRARQANRLGQRRIELAEELVLMSRKPE